MYAAINSLTSRFTESLLQTMLYADRLPQRFSIQAVFVSIMRGTNNKNKLLLLLLPGFDSSEQSLHEFFLLPSHNWSPDVEVKPVWMCCPLSAQRLVISGPLSAKWVLSNRTLYGPMIKLLRTVCF